MARIDKILTAPNKLLRRKAKPLKIFTRGKCNRIKNLFELMYANNGMGLAAPQVGWNTRVFIINPTGHKEHEMVFINPIILETSGDLVQATEGCLSVPDVTGSVERRENIKIAYEDMDGYHVTLEASGLLARCILHENDHLDGVLFIDKVVENAS